MFGGMAFFLNGNMCAGVWKEYLVVCLSPEESKEAPLLAYRDGRRRQLSGEMGEHTVGATGARNCRLNSRIGLFDPKRLTPIPSRWRSMQPPSRRTSSSSQRSARPQQVATRFPNRKRVDCWRVARIKSPVRRVLGTTDHCPDTGWRQSAAIFHSTRLRIPAHTPCETGFPKGFGFVRVF